MQIFPESVRKRWNYWELRLLVLLSLFLQIILIIFGNWRKYSARNWIKVVLWLAYLSADWVATVSLGILCNNQGDSDSLSPDNVMMAFWAPFLLVHLGGPDTITAYSLEDNELWLRHLLGLVVQVGVAFYIFLRSWTTRSYHLMLLAIPMFIAGIVKYGERTWVLRSASYDHFEESLLPRHSQSHLKIKRHKLPPPRPKSPKHTEVEVVTDSSMEDEVIRNSSNSETKIYQDAFFFFKNFKRLYADLIFSEYEIQESRDFFINQSLEEAFKVIKLELGFMYDVLYTKASVVCSIVGCLLRCISFFSTVSVFAGFLIIEKHSYSRINVSISYTLLVGAIILEIYAIILLLSSDWAVLWLTKNCSGHLNLIFEVISSLRFSIEDKNNWAGSMAQFNMINFSLRRKPPKFYNYFSFWKRVEKRQHIYLEGISIDMRKLFFDHLQERAKLEGVEKTSKQRGDGIIGLFTNLSKLRWSVAEVDFDESILLWHMATDLCHYSDLNNTNKDAFHSPYLQMSRLLSDYMLYLLVMCPFMLPKGIGQIRFDLATQQAMSYFQLKDLAGYSSRNEACRILIEVDNEDPPPSMILDGCELAKILQSELKTVTKTNDGSEWEKWKIICHVWVEMLCFAANQCGWRYHAQQLGRGGELLTQISLLMAHFGLTDQMRNTAGDTTGSRQGISRHATSFRDLVDFVDRKEAEVKAMLRRRQFRPMGHTNEYDSENGDLSPMSI